MAEYPMTAEKRCYGWPVGQPCENKPGSKWGPHWCPSCDQKRMAHLELQFVKLREAFGVER